MGFDSISIIVISIAVVYFLILFYLIINKKTIKKTIDSKLNSKFVNKFQIRKRGNLTFTTSILDEIETDHEQNDLLDQFKNNNSTILNSQNHEKKSLNNDSKVIKISSKKEK